jgi:stearoyl-CoA desaturase (delta-9 desaturase)
MNQPSPMVQGKKGVWWINGVFVAYVHLVALAAVCLYRITMGYHRLWSHRAFKVHPVLKWILVLWGTMGFQGTVDNGRQF